MTGPRILTPAEQQRLDALHLCLDDAEPVLICRPCGYALKPFGERVGRHLAEKHDVPKPKRRGLNGLIKSIGLADPNDVPLRPDGLPPHEALLTVRGYACRHCNYRTVSLDLVGRHVSSVHGFKQNRKAHGWQRDHVLEGVSLQSWSQNGSRGYWIALPPTPTSPSHWVDSLPSHEASTGQRALLAAAHDAERARLASRLPAAATDEGRVDPALQTNWMRRTGWAGTFEGARRDILATMTQLPASMNSSAPLSTGLHLGLDGEGDPLISPPEDEARLRCIVSAVDGLLDRCEDTIRHTDVSIRCWLRSSEPQRPYKAPFELVSRPSTTYRYRRYIKKLLCFCFRLWRLPLGPRLSQCRRTLTVTQSRAFQALWSDSVWTAVPLHNTSPDNRSSPESPVCVEGTSTDGDGRRTIQTRSATRPRATRVTMPHTPSLADKAQRASSPESTSESEIDTEDDEEDMSDMESEEGRPRSDDLEEPWDSVYTHHHRDTRATGGELRAGIATSSIPGPSSHPSLFPQPMLIWIHRPRDS
ncbi:hypothetical protein CSOJ01_15498 [Colletotrichum sojae]|uniref:C2H2-type domain-containing protein n=1 Tax=Colletotrichum sojae TaxID=2175907 RepID=A0A8H6IM56_9PEZI|nr:hypothetical protein CSOJ01_15498 [Colletotrichum sojae]